jgi:transposase
MVKPRVNYSREFRLRVCREIESGITIAEASRRHQVHPRVLYRWAKEYRQDPTIPRATGKRRQPAETATDTTEARVAELERLVGRLTLENEFLKKTLRTVETTFGRVPPKDGTR